MTADGENFTSQLQGGSGSLKDKRVVNSIEFKKKYFGVIPTRLIKQLEPSNLYEDRLRAFTEISRKYVVDNDNFEELTKYLNEFIAYLFEISHEEVKNEVESLSYEAIVVLNKILK